MLEVTHLRILAQTLDDSIIVDEDGRLAPVDLRHPIQHIFCDIEALPLSREILRAAENAALLGNHAGAGDSDEGRQRESYALGAADRLPQPLDDVPQHLLSARLAISVPPKFVGPDTRIPGHLA